MDARELQRQATLPRRMGGKAFDQALRTQQRLLAASEWTAQRPGSRCCENGISSKSPNTLYVRSLLYLAELRYPALGKLVGNSRIRHKHIFGVVPAKFDPANAPAVDFMIGLRFKFHAVIKYFVRIP